MTEEASELRRDPETAAEMAVKAVLNYLHGCDVVGEEEKREWINLVFERVKAKELAH